MTSTVPAAIAALVELCQAAVTEADVYDGPPTTADYPDWVGIAYRPTGGEMVTTTTEWAALGSQRHEETYDITCIIGSENGDLTPVALRLRCYELLDQIALALADDYTLGGAVRVAHVSAHTFLTEVDDSGMSSSLSFTVNVTARI